MTTGLSFVQPRKLDQEEGKEAHGAGMILQGLLNQGTNHYFLEKYSNHYV